MRIERLRRREDGQAEERRLGHAQEEVRDSCRVGQAPGRRIGANDGPPEEQCRAQIKGVLEEMDEVVLERRVEERGEVAGPHDGGEQDPRDHREGKDPHDARVEHREQEALPSLR